MESKAARIPRYLSIVEIGWVSGWGGVKEEGGWGRRCAISHGEFFFCGNAAGSSTKRHCERDCTRESRRSLCNVKVTITRPGSYIITTIAAEPFASFLAKRNERCSAPPPPLRRGETEKSRGKRGCCTRVPEISPTSSKFVVASVVPSTGAR